MVEDLTKEANMEPPQENLHLSIHKLELFKPRAIPIVYMIPDEYGNHHGIIKHLFIDNHKPDTISFIEIYRTDLNCEPRLIQRLQIHAKVTAFTWLSDSNILTVDMNQTISIYSVKLNTLIYSKTTDFGPITCMKYLWQYETLIAATQYGYITAYKIKLKALDIKFIKKLTKINGSIQCMDLFIDFEHPLKDIKKIEPGKRKRSDRDKPLDKLKNYPITIYGSCGAAVTAWDYHKETIVDTVQVGEKALQVCSLLVIRNGHLIVGDSKGSLSVFDHKTFTFRQNLKLFESPVLCISKCEGSKTVYACGQEYLARLRARSSGEVIICEKNRIPVDGIVSLIFQRRRTFYVAGKGGFIVRCDIPDDDSRKEIKKTLKLPPWNRSIEFYGREVMIKQPTNLNLWKFPKVSLNDDDNQLHELSGCVPTNNLRLKTKNFIHASTFTKDWICYSTKKFLHVYHRIGAEIQEVEVDRKLSECHLLSISRDGNTLAACTGSFIYFINLDLDLAKSNSKDSISKHCCKVMESQARLKASVTNIMSPSSDIFVASVGPYSNHVMTYQRAEDSSGFHLISEINLGDFQVSLISRNPLDKSNSVYIITSGNHLLKHNFREKTEESCNFSKQLSDDKIIENLPFDSDIFGMLHIDENNFIIYDQKRMYKLDIGENRITKQNSAFSTIAGLYNGAFSKPYHLVLMKMPKAA